MLVWPVVVRDHSHGVRLDGEDGVLQKTAGVGRRGGRERNLIEVPVDREEFYAEAARYDGPRKVVVRHCVVALSLLPATTKKRREQQVNGLLRFADARAAVVSSRPLRRVRPRLANGHGRLAIFGWCPMPGLLEASAQAELYQAKHRVLPWRGTSIRTGPIRREVFASAARTLVR